MNKFVNILLIFFFLIGFSLELVSQDKVTNTITDSTRLELNKKDSTITKLKKDPTTAIIRSLILPGWGQYYNESYWKAPVFVAAWGTILFFIYDNNNKYNQAANEYANYSGTDLAQQNYLYRKREYFRDYRDLNILYLAGVYIISAIDAYSDANLYEFNVNNNISLNYGINNFGSVLVSLKVEF